MRVGNGKCDKDLDTLACGFDGGDCVADYSNSTKGFDGGNIFDTKSIEDASASYSDELRAKLLEKALLRGLF